MASVIRVEHGARSSWPDAERPVPRAEMFHDFQRRADVEYDRSLSQLIEREIIPRLLVAHGAGPLAAGHAAHDDTILPEEVEAFAPLSLQVEADELLDHVDALVARGVSIDTLMVDLLAPAARLLGQFWEDDRCDFVDVTMGLWRLQEVVHELSARVPPERRGPAEGRRALFASMPGDQHSFGTVVLDELFARAGWRTARLCEAEVADLAERLGEEWFDLVGLTISCDCHIATTPSVIQALRKASRNRRLCVMVGGRVFVGRGELADAVGADGTAPDARAAVQVAGALVDRAVRGAAQIGAWGGLSLANG